MNKKNGHWNMVMFTSMIVMVAGFILSLFGIHINNHAFSYLGIGMMTVTSVTWWFWVMFIIKDMFERVERTGDRIVEVKQELGVIRALIKNPFKR